ncbi:hypothetical protein NDU88_005333 [Pleurodeles waltl]|uniref:Reverse transcriptase zinc-binding domain-containing protein n=1 Tax=Pleurodeles waltl TaxID=8319 RepID=A0AAV7WUF7_PLEWA|nr:hypothetical protein NDU88_005333 [Pleurodeles waltl]
MVLYQASATIAPDRACQFLEDVSLLRLPSLEMQQLDEPLSEKEIGEAISVQGMGDAMKSFQELQADLQLSRTQFFEYLQLWHALGTHLTPTDPIPEFNPLEARLLMGNSGGKGVSQIYKALVNHAPGSLDSNRSKWESWVGELKEPDWAEALMAPRMLAVSARLRAVQFYYLHRAYLAPDRLHWAGLRPTALCPRCAGEPADLFHMVLSCPVL